MPTYDFVCDDHGRFELRRSFAEAGDDALCPQCGAGARRLYSMPNTNRTPEGLSRAMNRVEKSAHEPETVRRRVGSDEHKHNHGHGRPWQIGH